MTKQPNPLSRSRKVQKSGAMRLISRHSSRFTALFGHRFGLANHWIALRFRNAGSFGPSRRFSARFGPVSRCAQLCQNSKHASTYLPGSEHLLSAFPRSKAGLSQVASQNQLLHGRGYDQTPAFKLLWAAHPRFGSEQVLLEKAVGVLMREAVAIGRNHLAQRQGHLASPAKPAFARVTLGPFGPLSHDTVDAHFPLACLSKVQMVPRKHLDGVARFVVALPLLIGLAPGLRLAALKQAPIFARRSSFARLGRWGRSIELTIAFETHQGFYLQPLTSREKGSGGIPAIGQQSHSIGQEWPQVLQLRYCYLDGGLGAGHALLREDGSPTAAARGQEHHRRELPADTDRSFGMGQVRDVNDATLRAGFGFRACNRGGVNADPHRPFVLSHQDFCPDLAPTLAVDLAIFQCCINAGPFASEAWREREFRQRSGCTLARQGIRQLKEGIGRSGKTLPGLMTNLYQCVKVHLSNAPYSLWFEATLLALAILRKGDCLFGFR